MILEHLLKKAPQGNKERYPLVKGPYPYGSNLILDLSLAFPLPPFVKMCFNFFCGTYLMKKDTKISKSFSYLEIPTLHAIGSIRWGNLIFGCNL
jgi:hypothetical protein